MAQLYTAHQKWQLLREVGPPESDRDICTRPEQETLFGEHPDPDIRKAINKTLPNPLHGVSFHRANFAVSLVQHSDYSASTMSPPNGISLQGTVYVARENADKFLEAFQAVFKLVVAEPDCVFVEVFQSQEDPGTISWVEDWYAQLGSPLRVARSSTNRQEIGPSQRNGFSKYAKRTSADDWQS